MPPLTYAGFWIRFLALLIDIVCLFASIWLVAVPLMVVVAGLLTADDFAKLEASEGIQSKADIFNFAINLGLPWLYEAFFTSSSWQATPGKRLLGLRVADMAGRRIGFVRATARHFAKYLWFGLLIQPLTGRRQALHDKIGGTVVTRV